MMFKAFSLLTALAVLGIQSAYPHGGGLDSNGCLDT